MLSGISLLNFVCTFGKLPGRHTVHAVSQRFSSNIFSDISSGNQTLIATKICQSRVSFINPSSPMNKQGLLSKKHGRLTVSTNVPNPFLYSRLHQSSRNEISRFCQTQCAKFSCSPIFRLAIDDQPPPTISTTTKISLESIGNHFQSHLANEVLSFFSILDQAPIPLELIQSWFNHHYPDRTKLDLVEALQLLINSSIIENPIEKIYHAPFLVQKVISPQSGSIKQEQILQQSLLALLDLTKELDYSVPEVRERFALLIPHIEKILCHVYPSQNDAINKLLSATWEYYNFIGEHKNGERIARFSLSLWDDTSINKAIALSRLGVTLSAMGRYEEALEYHHQALDLNIALLPKKHQDIAASLNDIGIIYGQLGKYQEGLNHQIQALELYKELLGSEHAFVAIMSQNVGWTLGLLGKYEEALNYLLKALEINKKLFGEKHPNVASSLNNMAIILGRLGRHEEAINYQLQAFDLKKELLGEKHPYIANSLDSLGWHLYQSGKHQEALDKFIQSFRILYEVFNNKHRSHEETLEKIISCLNYQTNLELICKVKNEILPLATSRLGEEHPLVDSLRKFG